MARSQKNSAAVLNIVGTGGLTSLGHTVEMRCQDIAAIPTKQFLLQLKKGKTVQLTIQSTAALSISPTNPQKNKDMQKIFLLTLAVI